MMFKFSCFNPHIHSHKQKKTVHLSSRAMHKILEDCSPNQSMKNSNYSQATTPPYLNLEEDAVKIFTDCATDSSVGCEWRSQDMEKYAVDNDMLLSVTAPHIKKSQSLGSGLDMTGRDSGDIASEDEIDRQFSCDGSHNNSHGLDEAKDSGTSTPQPSQEALSSDACQINADGVNHESICSMGYIQQSEKEGLENFDSHLSGPVESFDLTPCAPAGIGKSNSLPNIVLTGRVYPLTHSRSAEDLSVGDSRQKKILTHEVKIQELQHLDRNYEEWNSNEKNNYENNVHESYDTCGCIGSSKDWIIPAADEVNEQGNRRRYSSYQWDELPNKDFKVKRIEEWVIDLQHCSSLEGSNECSSEVHDSPKSSNVLDVEPATRMDGKVSNPSMEAAKKYISSLSAMSTAAQLVNHGLAVIPFLSAFSSLRTINLSGNAIVRITAGALPRGLHVLNLSKNNISIIEGLRELTRLRILDLSYNRLLRIGHGLASCSSLKELYLAGNKISEVEGLHRLLKLYVLDLRFNKISTTKCLGQLAANYVSLQAISLEGNPAQKNVGNEQLKKYLQGLLPHLTYLNRQPIKSGTLKDPAERSARLGMSAHQIDRGLKPELKAIRKATHSNASQRLSGSSNHGRRSQVTAASKPSKGRHVRFPPNGTKIGTQQSHFHDFNSNLLNFRSSEFSMRRSRSEGTLGAI